MANRPDREGSLEPGASGMQDRPPAATSTALVVVDMQNFFLRPGSFAFNERYLSIIPNINALGKAVRAVGGVVVFLRHTFDDQGPMPVPDWEFADPAQRSQMAEGLAPASEGHGLYAGLDASPADAKVNKYRPSAFVPGSSQLHAMLRRQRIERIIVAGILTNVCSESTARDARMLDYKVMFISDANATVSDELHNASLANLSFYFADVLTTAEALHRLAVSG